jgi:hypothetical protein
MEKDDHHQMADGKELVIVKELTERKSQVMSSSKG